MFFNYVPTASNLYVKPSNAGLKRNKVKRKYTCREAAKPEIFVDPFTSQLQITIKSFVRPVKIKKMGPDMFAISEPETLKEESEENDESHLLNPNRKSLKSFILVHRKDKINSPMKVSRYHSCTLKFQSTDIVVVKTQGEREWFDQKQGKLRKSLGNVYLHYLKKHLKEFDLTFTFSKIVVLKETIKLLPTNAVNKVKKQGLKFQS